MEHLLRARPGFDLLDLRGLALDDISRSVVRTALGTRALERVYERCPVIETTGSWDDYLHSRRKKFRANLKRAARRVDEQGRAVVAHARADAQLLSELDAVERESWKWGNGTAYFRIRERKAFLSQVLLDPEIPSEVWTCRIDGELAGFAVVFRKSRSRQYYLPSFRSHYTDVGSYLLGQIVRESFSDPIDEVDLLQGDEGYKIAWATTERAVHQIVATRGRLVGLATGLAVSARWRLAQFERVRRIHARLASWRGRRADS
jgi:CelD/BcsL family acetyltransferase involved in cellulose biosynthesis